MYLGNQPALSYTSFAKQDFTTSATTSYTLDNPVANENELALFINFVRQEPTTAYTASGTSLTLTSATSASDDMYCVYLGKAVQTVNPPNGSVGASQIADGSIALAKLSATGTKDSTTFLRGDNTFASAGGANTPAFQAYASSNQNMTPSTFTKVNFAGETFDTNSNYDTSTSRFTPTVAGKYFIASQITTTYSGTGPANEYMELRKNGSNIKRGNQRGADHGYGFNYVAEIVEFNGSSDYVEIFSYGDPSTTYIMEGNSSGNESTFYGYKIIE